MVDSCFEFLDGGFGLGGPLEAFASRGEFEKRGSESGGMGNEGLVLHITRPRNDCTCLAFLRGVGKASKALSRFSAALIPVGVIMYPRKLTVSCRNWHFSKQT